MLLLLLLLLLLDSRHGRIHSLGICFKIQSAMVMVDNFSRWSSELFRRSHNLRMKLPCTCCSVVAVVDHHVIGLGLLKLGHELLYQIVSFLDQLLIGHIKLILIKEISGMVSRLLKLAQLNLHLGQL